MVRHSVSHRLQNIRVGVESKVRGPREGTGKGGWLEGEGREWERVSGVGGIVLSVAARLRQNR